MMYAATTVAAKLFEPFGKLVEVVDANPFVLPLPVVVSLFSSYTGTRKILQKTAMSDRYDPMRVMRKRHTASIPQVCKISVSWICIVYQIQLQ